jgi:hypothetical protein
MCYCDRCGRQYQEDLSDNVLYLYTNLMKTCETLSVHPTSGEGKSGMPHPVSLDEGSRIIDICYAPLILTINYMLLLSHTLFSDNLS